MLHDVKVRTYDALRKTESVEIITVDAAGGDDAAEMALALRPGASVIGVTGHGGFAPAGGAAVLEADDTPPDDEDGEPGPSNRELASMPMMRPRLAPAPPPPLAAPDPAEAGLVTANPAPKRGPGRPRKEQPKEPAA